MLGRSELREAWASLTTMWPLLSASADLAEPPRPGGLGGWGLGPGWWELRTAEGRALVFVIRHHSLPHPRAPAAQFRKTRQTDQEWEHTSSCPAAGGPGRQDHRSSEVSLSVQRQQNQCGQPSKVLSGRQPPALAVSPGASHGPSEPSLLLGPTRKEPAKRVSGSLPACTSHGIPWV